MPDSRRLLERHDAGWNAQDLDAIIVEWDGVDVFPLRDGLIARKDVYSTSHIPRSV